MSIQPPNIRPHEISVTEAIEPAYERVKQILFRPFNLNKWIVIGFCAWLAGLGEAGGGGGSGFNGGNQNFNGNGPEVREQFRQTYDHARTYVLANLNWILPLAAFLVVFCLGLWFVLLWLNSRGKFMFLHCVALDRAEIEVPWVQFKRPANSLFLFRLVLGVIQLVLVLPLVVFLAVTIIHMVLQNQANVPGILMSVGLGLCILVMVLLFSILHKFLTDFIVPLMFLRGGSCLDAWREFGRLLTQHFGKFVVYLLFQIVLSMAIGMLVLAAVLVTCCIAGCFMLLPFVGTVMLLPVLVFKRAYPLYYLAQFGPEYNVFPKPEAPPAEPVSPNFPLAPVS